MSFDNSRFTFNPRNDYSGVVMEQGRVQLDSDWNEWLAEFARRIQAGTLDMLGRAVYPATTPYAFKITASIWRHRTCSRSARDACMSMAAGREPR